MTDFHDIVERTRKVVEDGLISSLPVNELVESDLANIRWSGSETHIESVASHLQRPPGEVDYLCLRAPSGEPVAKAGIDYAAHPDAGTIWQVAVHPGLQGLGVGTYVLDAAEQRIRARGLKEARLGVDDGNDEALRLYLRLGYVPCGRWESSWPAIDHLGQRYEHHAVGTDLSKRL